MTDSITLNTDDALRHASFLLEAYSTPQAKLAVCIKKGKQLSTTFITNVDELNELLSTQDIFDADVYITPNSFFVPRTLQKFLHKLGFLYVDLDKHFGTVDEHDIQGLIYTLENDLIGKVPKPSLIVSTGRGLHLYWKIKAISWNKNTKAFWNKAEKGILKLFEDFEYNGFQIDPKVSNPNRLLRLAGTSNPAAGRTVKIEYMSDDEYSLTDITQGFVFGFSPQQVQSQEPYEYTAKDEQNLLTTRIADLEKLIHMRGGEMRGHRQFVIWVCRNALMQLDKSEEYSQSRLNEINGLFSDPLPQEEVDRELSRNDVYSFTNKYLIAELKITAAEQKKLRSIIGTIERRNRSAKQRAEQVALNKDFKAIDKSNRLNEVLEYINLGFPQAQIAGLLGYDIRTIKKIYKELGVDKTITSNKDAVLELKAKGLTQQQVAEQLNISIRTVRSHWHTTSRNKN